MSISAVPWDVFHLEPYSETESLDELLADENFSPESVDMEVEACHSQEE